MSPYEIKKVTFDVENDCIVVEIYDCNSKITNVVTLSAYDVMDLMQKYN